jgi:hypothetical protein
VSAKELRERAMAFANEFRAECAAELLEWQDTAILPNGRVRELAAMLSELDSHNSMALAEHFIQRASLEFAASPATPAEDARDAARYRFWRDAAGHPYVIGIANDEAHSDIIEACGDSLDQITDAAMQASAGQGDNHGNQDEKA